MYRALNLILKNKRGVNVLCKLTRGGSRFLTTSFDGKKSSRLGYVPFKGFTEQEQRFSRISGREGSSQSVKYLFYNLNRE